MTPARIHNIVDWFVLVCFLVVCALCVSFIQMNYSKDDKIEKYKIELDHKDSQIYERQLKYEQEKDVSNQLGEDLADAQELLAETTEREKAAKVRASRSRQSRVASPAASDQPRTQALPGTLSDITMYCPTGSRTASGKWPTVGMVATISRSIPFGARILISGLGEFTVEDRIGHGSEFDIFTPSCSEADRFGRQHRRVTILDTD